MSRQIFIKAPDNKSYVFVFDDETMPLDCLAFIDTKVGCDNPSGGDGKIMNYWNDGLIKFNLMCNGKFLSNDLPLAEQNVQNDCTLYLKIISL